MLSCRFSSSGSPIFNVPACHRAFCSLHVPGGSTGRGHGTPHTHAHPTHPATACHYVSRGHRLRTNVYFILFLGTSPPSQDPRGEPARWVAGWVAWRVLISRGWVHGWVTDGFGGGFTWGGFAGGFPCPPFAVHMHKSTYTQKSESKSSIRIG